MERVLIPLLLCGCFAADDAADPDGDGCALSACVALCLGDGFSGGGCVDGRCSCSGPDDAGTDAAADSDGAEPDADPPEAEAETDDVSAEDTAADVTEPEAESDVYEAEACLPGDDDCDGCVDLDGDTAVACSPTCPTGTDFHDTDPLIVGGSGSEFGMAVCHDGIDNDCDGTTDCDDIQCAVIFECP